MSAKSKKKFMLVFLSGLGILSVGAKIYHLSSSVNEAKVSIALKHKDDAIVDLELVVYAENRESCHGGSLKRQADWRQREADVNLPAPSHDETRHIWHHTDSSTHGYILFKWL